MIGRYSNLVYGLVFLTALVCAGCQPRQKQVEDILACGPDVETISVTKGYAARAIAAAGGYKAWIETKKLSLDGVVTFYKSDDSFYLTEQHYEVYPWSNSIRISSVEPQGKLTWQLSRAVAKEEQFQHTGAGFPIRLCGEHCFCELLLDLITVPVRFLDKPVEFTEISEPVKIKGRWYYPIERANHCNAGIWSEAIFYQNRDSGLVDIIRFTDVDNGSSFAVRGYDYSRVEKDGIQIPAKIEIFQADVAGDLSHRLVKIDIK